MPAKAIDTAKKQSAQNLQRVQDVQARASNLPAVIKPTKPPVAKPTKLITIGDNGVPQLGMTLENAQEMVTSCFSTLDNIDSQIDALNARKSGVRKMLRDAGFDVKELIETRRELMLDPTALAVRRGTRHLYRQLFVGLLIDAQAEGVA